MQVDARVGVRNRHLETRRRREQERERETVKALIMRHRESERTRQSERERVRVSNNIGEEMAESIDRKTMTAAAVAKESISASSFCNAIFDVKIFAPF